MKPSRPELLVSVRDAEEAAAALQGGAEIIDVKEPAAGSLGAADPQAVLGVARIVSGRVPWTMACGELSAGVQLLCRHLGTTLGLLADEGLAPPWAVKVGLSAMASRAWRDDLIVLGHRLPRGVRQVAVLYADHHDCHAPASEEVLGFAAEIPALAVLVDTFDKAAPGVLDVQPLPRLREWRDAAARARMGFALAGKLAMDDLPTAASVLPDIIAVRSAVCSRGRNGPVEASLVRQAREAVATCGDSCSPVHGIVQAIFSPEKYPS